MNEIVKTQGSKTVEGWLAENRDEIEQAQAFALAPLSDEPAVMGQDLSRANSEQARMGLLLVDASSFVAQAEAVAMMRVRREYDDLSASERRVMVKADAEYQCAVRLRDSLDIIMSALKSKSMSIMNLRRTTFTPHQSHE